MFIMSTIADGPYWPSALEPLLYPTGCSLYRPFSYQKDFVLPVLLDELADPERLSTFLNDSKRSRGVFGIRLRGRTSEDEKEATPENAEKYGKTFIPLRWVKLTSVHITDSVQLSFTLGDYIDLKDKAKDKDRKDKQFQPISLQDEIGSLKRETILMVEISSEKMKPFEKVTQLPEGLWTRLADDEALSPLAREHFRGTTVLRLVGVTERGSTSALAPASLEPDREDKIYGLKLTAGRVFDFEFAYNRIFGPRESREQFLYDYAFGGPSEHFKASRNTIRITGNYRTESLWVQPIVAQPASVLLEWDGVKRTDKGQVGDLRIEKIMPLRVPVISVAHFWSRDRIVDGIVTLMSFVAMAFCFYLAYQIAATASVPPQPGGQSISPSVTPVLLALGAFSAGIFGGFLKDFIRGRS